MFEAEACSAGSLSGPPGNRIPTFGLIKSADFLGFSNVVVLYAERVSEASSRVAIGVVLLVLLANLVFLDLDLLLPRYLLALS